MKQLLEQEFDVPFTVKKRGSDYTFYPKNDYEELFEVHITHPSDVRIVMEAYPQAHAADMLHDMATASEEKRKLFLAYLDMFRQKNAKISVKVNGANTDLTEWPKDWKNLHIRITRIEDPDSDPDESAKEMGVSAAAMMLSLLNIVPLGYEDGAKTEVTTNKYERNRLNRELCLKLQGTTCKICGMNFEKVYGGIGKGFIHVHHIEPVSLMGGAYVMDPEKDLIPVCPNCHAMLHTKTPPLKPEELIKILQENNLQ